MKKLIISIIIMCACAFSVSCGSSEPEMLKTEPVVGEAVNQTVSTVNKADFDVMPTKANKSLNKLIGTIKSVYTDVDGDFQYGYRGTTTVGDDSCYIFSVYSFADDSHVKLGDFAQSASGKSVYLFNEETSEYELVEIEENEDNAWVNKINLKTIENNVKNATKLAVENLAD